MRRWASPLTLDHPPLFPGPRSPHLIRKGWLLKLMLSEEFLPVQFVIPRIFAVSNITIMRTNASF